MTAEKHEFQTEVARLLHLVTHSLYSNREIFLRELISNASDACDRLRFEALENPELYGGQPELRIRIQCDQEKKTITIRDSGIGMSRADIIENLGTIAHSGTRAFLQQMEGDKKADSQLIGQFGVGFYSGFIVADKIEVLSRRAGLGAEAGVRWTSDGSGQFEVEPLTLAERGTSVSLHLRDDALEFAQGWRLRELIARYSDHIALPIEMEAEKWEEGENDKPGQMVKTGAWEAVNQATALWTRARKDISEEQAAQFYQQLARDWQPPLAWRLHRVEGSTEYTQLLYIPSHAPLNMWERERKEGLKLYVRRVFIMDDAEQLLPRYLRFVKGVVDSADLPLNVSREILQESRDVRAIRDGNTRRILAMLEDMANVPEKAQENTEDAKKEEKQKEKTPDYRVFWREFGAVLKEGIAEDATNQARIARLLRYESTAGDFVSLADYKARMKDGQKAIYYMCADSQGAARNSPQLEAFRKKGIEVLLMGERIDEWVMQWLREFDGTPLLSAARGAADLDELQSEEEKKAFDAASESAKALIEKLKAALGDAVDEVRATARLVDSPACLVVKETDVSLNMARMLRQAGQKLPDIKPILEINPAHPLIVKMGGDEAHFDELAHIVLDQALLAEGLMPRDAAAYVRRVNALLV